MLEKQKPKQLNINQLPDLCLLSIFARLPLHDLLNLSRVCTRWNSLQSSACATRRELTLVISRKQRLNRQWIFQHNVTYHDQKVCTVKVARLDLEMSQKLLKIFNQIESLEIVLNQCSLNSILASILLMQNLTKQLTSLKVYCQLKSSLSLKMKSVISEQLRQNLLPALNGLIQLEHLTISFYGCFVDANAHAQLHQQIQLPVLSQLREFNFYSHDPADRLYESFRKYLSTSETRIKQFQLFSMINDSLDQFVDINSHLADKILTLYVTRFDLNQFRRFCLNFTSLTTLAINPGRFSLVQLVNCAHALKQLETLRFVINFGQAAPTFSADDQLPVNEIRQLGAVKRLQIIMPHELHSHSALESRHLGWIFPNLVLLNIEYPLKFRCVDCARRFGACIRVASLRRKCIRQLWDPWRQCASLRDVHTKAFTTGRKDHYTHDRL